MQNRLLIADGCLFQSMRIKSYLALRGYQVDIASDALECIESMRRTLPDVLILDCALLWGGCDGVIDWLQEAPLRSKVRVVLTCEESCHENSHSAIVAQLRRPFNVEELFAAVRFAVSFDPQPAAQANRRPTDFFESNLTMSIH